MDRHARMCCRIRLGSHAWCVRVQFLLLRDVFFQSNAGHQRWAVGEFKVSNDFRCGGCRQHVSVLQVGCAPYRSCTVIRRHCRFPRFTSRDIAVRDLAHCRGICHSRLKSWVCHTFSFVCARIQSSKSRSPKDKLVGRVSIDLRCVVDYRTRVRESMNDSHLQVSQSTCSHCE